MNYRPSSRSAIKVADAPEGMFTMPLSLNLSQHRATTRQTVNARTTHSHVEAEAWDAGFVSRCDPALFDLRVLSWPGVGITSERLWVRRCGLVFGGLWW
jgi:hypothetical protein